MNPDTRTPTGPSAGGRKNKSSTQQQQQQQQQSQLRTPTTTPSEYKKIKAQWAAAQALLEKEKLDAARKKSGDADDGKGKGASERELLRAVKERDVAKNVVEENEFKRWHGGIMGVLGWFL